MENINTDPIYKILCMAAVLLIPLLPAILLYEIAPKEKFFSSGSFSGFKINATGASAIYIILFVAFYAKVDFILANIDAYKALQQKFQGMPWRVNCKVTLMVDPTHKMNPFDAEKIIDKKFVACFPNSPRCTDQTVSFLIDNNDLDNNGKISGGMLMINNGFGSVSLEDATTIRDPDNRIITINSVFEKQSKNNYGSQSTDNFTIPVIDKSQGLPQPPKPNQ